MATAILRIVKYGFQNFIRNSLLSVATVIVLILVLTGFEGLSIFRVVANTAVDSLKDKIDISVSFKTNVSEDDILKVKKALESLKEVKSVEYVSRDKALEILQANYQDEPAISQALLVLGNNPLYASLNIKSDDPKNYETIASYLKNDEDLKPMIADLSFEKSKADIDKLSAFIDTLEKMGFILVICLVLTAVLIIFNTIKIAIYSNREEIWIMRLVGASGWFINGPYIVEAIIFGLLAAIFSLLIVGPIINFAAPHIRSFIPEMNIETYFYSHLFSIFLYQILFGTFLSFVSGMVAIRKYIKN